MRNQYRIDIVDSKLYDLKSPPCGMNTIVYLSQCPARTKQVEELADAIKEGKALLCSKYDADKRDYVVYSSFVK